MAASGPGVPLLLAHVAQIQAKHVCSGEMSMEMVRPVWARILSASVLAKIGGRGALLSAEVPLEIAVAKQFSYSLNAKE